MDRKSLSKWIVKACVLQSALTLAKPVGHDKHLSMVGGSLSKMLVPSPIPDMFRPEAETRHVAKRDANWIVQAGDTGNGIAARLGIEFVQLAYMNPTVQWTNLQIGQVLRIPCGDENTTPTVPPPATASQYTVVAGDTGNAIAAASGTTFAALEAANPGINWYNLQIGQVLNIPRPAPSTTTSSMTPSTSPLTSSLTTTTTISLVPPTAPTSPPVDPVPPVTPPEEQTPPTSPVIPPADSSTPGDVPSPEPYPLDGPDTSPFLTPGQNKRAEMDLPIFKIRLTRNEQAQSKSSSTSYTVKAGDTGYAIAAVNGVSFSSLSDLNPGVVWTNLQTGQTLKLPSTTKQISTMVQSQTRKTGQDVHMTFSGPASIPPYPAMSNWLSFETLWAKNLPNIGTNCVFSAGRVPSNTQAETAALKNAIQAIASDTSLNAAFILATILQESAGCVRAPTTKSWEGISNPGLMQSFKGRATCNSNGRFAQPCSDRVIKGMIEDGVKGNVNVGIVPALAIAARNFGVIWPMSVKITTRAGGQQNKPLLAAGSMKKVDEALLYYQAARIYNSGSLPVDGNLSGATGSTRCYVSDIVNRLMGWVNAKKECSF